MKRFIKKTVALSAAFAMTLTLAPITQAENSSSQTNTGKGELEDYINKDVYDVVLPVVTNNALDFVADPQGLLKVANATKYTIGEGAVYFKHGTVENTTYSNTSDDMTVYNKSSYDVDVSVAVKVATATESTDSNVKLAEKSALATAKIPSLYIGLIKESEEAVAVTSDGIKDESTTLDAVKEADGATVEKGYKVTATESGSSPSGYSYTYALTDDFQNTDAKNVTFKLEGACDTTADWSAVDTTDGTLSAEIVWNVCQHLDKAVTVKSDSLALTYDKYDNDTSAANANDLEIATYRGYDASEISISVALDEEDAVTEDVETVDDESLEATIKDGSIKLKATYLATLAKSDNDYIFTITYGDDATVTQKVTISDSTPAAAPSIAVEEATYSKASGGATITVDLGAGSKAATGISKLEIGVSDTDITTSYGGEYSLNGTSLKLNDSYIGAATGSVRYIKITFNDTSSTAVIVKLNVAD